MNKVKLMASLTSATVLSIAATQPIQASENPFASAQVSHAIQLAEAGDKSREGKCSDGKCGNKMKEGGCSGTMSKMREGKCGEGKCGDGKMSEGGCSASMDQDSNN